MAQYPTSIPTFTGFTSGQTLQAAGHAAQHNSEQAEIPAIATKVGTGSATPANNQVLRGNGAGTSTWAQVNLTTDVTGTLPTSLGGSGTTSLTFPAGTDTLIARNSTDTLANKTLSSPVVTTPPANIARVTGEIVAYGGSAAPSGWLLCDGSAISRTTQATLFTAIGTAYGVGDGSTTFNLPNLQQKFPLGKAASGTGSILGGTGGAIDHTHRQTVGADGAAVYVRTDNPNGSDVFTVARISIGATSSSNAARIDYTDPNNPPYQVVNYIIKT